MSLSSGSSHSPNGSSGGQTPYQDQLTGFCRSNGLRTPTWQIVSDRRGGRTAWSCTVNIQGQSISARFWYDGQYVNSAREDAAQIALERLGQLRPSGMPPAQQLQQPGNQGGGQRPYGVSG
ncbi:hypothetical protein LTR37_017189 [Vermiconidia calcicola]|uniref:Uncharacterized protein n=1 Tax=Vermiconidia calcicola TaxID=1690605 RepID=A0ACC3MKR2_9PEZI|nr:hypothetical protein LTR37_017189 [Vermiconidia calcicola]